MQLEQNFTINGQVVTKTVNQLAGMDIYQATDDEFRLILFFVLENEVISTMTVEADCMQNCGFVSDWSVNNLQTPADKKTSLFACSN